MTTQAIRVPREQTLQAPTSRVGERLRGPAELIRTPGFLQLVLSNAFSQSFAMRMQGLAIAWVVLEMTDSRMWLGIVNGVPAVAVVLFSLAGGVLADTRDSRKVLIAVRSMLAASAFLACLLVTTGSIGIEHLMIYALLVVGLSAIDMPVGRTLTLQSVGPGRLMNANAMQTLGMNLINIVAPTSMAVLIGLAGPGAAFTVLGAGYAFGALLIFRSRLGGAPAEPRRPSPLADLRAGLAYVQSTPTVAALVSLGFLMPFAGTYFAMIPVYARDVLSVGPGGLGLLVGSFSLGSLFGSITLVTSQRMGGRGFKVAVLSVVFGLGMIAFALSQNLVLSCAISLLMGFVASFWQNMVTTMVQTSAAPEMRGRALSIFTMGFQLASLGWLIGGFTASAFGPQIAVVMAGVAFAGLSTLIFALNREVCVID